MFRNTAAGSLSAGRAFTKEGRSPDRAFLEVGKAETPLLTLSAFSRYLSHPLSTPHPGSPQFFCLKISAKAKPLIVIGVFFDSFRQKICLNLSLTENFAGGEQP